MVGMTWPSRSRLLVAAAALSGLAAIAAGVAVAATPAYAAPGISVSLAPSDVDMRAAEHASFTLTLTNSGLLAHLTVTATAPTRLDGEVSVHSTDSACSGSGTTVSCTVDIVGNGRKSLVFTLTASNPVSVPAGQRTTDRTGRVSVASGPDTTTLSYAVTLHGPAPAQPTAAASASSSAVSQVSGSVLDAGTGAPVTGAAVSLRDGTGTTFRAHTGPSGWFAFSSASDGQIRAGTLRITVHAAGYRSPPTTTIQARAGQSYTGIRIAIAPSPATPMPTQASPAAPGGLAADQRHPDTANRPALSWLLIAVGVTLALICAALLVRLLAARRAHPAPGAGDGMPPVAAAEDTLARGDEYRRW
jgi:Carboxypeptidase regulatory-like domain